LKKFISGIIFSCAALCLVCGAAFLCGFCGVLPRGAYVNGQDVGGLSLNAAKVKLREAEAARLSGKRFDICAGENVYSYTYPELNFSDCFGHMLGAITKKGEYFSPCRYYLCAANEVADYVCASIEKPLTEPYCAFDGSAFTYFEGNDGVSCNRAELLKQIDGVLNGGFCRSDASGNDVASITVTAEIEKREHTIEELKPKTSELYSFTTYFDGTNAPRVNNIRLAAQKVSGTVIQPGGTFSFNRIVGERTEERGFKKAKIIEGGRYVEGLGGGVCQVSTTLYNAALLSGLEITEYHPHSLAVSYVAPSRDAMVSGNYFDLKFKNNSITPIYIGVNCKNSSVNCKIFGLGDGFTYSIVSEVTGSIPKPSPVVTGTEGKLISIGKEGVLSSATLIKTNGLTREEIPLRTDKYLPTADVYS